MTGAPLPAGSDAVVPFERTARNEAGEVQTIVSQSASERADKNAMACLKDILKDHDDLPATFSRGIAVDWSHGR